MMTTRGWSSGRGERGLPRTLLPCPPSLPLPHTSPFSSLLGLLYSIIFFSHIPAPFPHPILCRSLLYYSLYPPSSPSTRRWQIKLTDDKGQNKCWAYCTVERVCRPEDCPQGGWWMTQGGVRVGQDEMTVRVEKEEKTYMKK